MKVEGISSHSSSSGVKTRSTNAGAYSGREDRVSVDTEWVDRANAMNVCQHYECRTGMGQKKFKIEIEL